MSDLLNSASLVMIPSGYKEDVVYSQIPTDGSGDLSFTRASNGTRVNSAGLVEVCPWNLLEQSNGFSGSSWVNDGTSETSGQSGYDGTNNAWLLIPNTVNTYHTIKNTFSEIGVLTFSVYAKAQTYPGILLYSGQTNNGKFFNLSNGTIGDNLGTGVISSSIENVGNGWYRCSMTINKTASGTFEILVSSDGIFTYSFAGNGTGGVFIQNAQANIGSTPKPYFPTTDRLNVPRLTYQNGGGGCPSLLLEKQSTNLALYSEQFDNAYWGKSAGTTVTANTTISPDGDTNADTIALAGSSDSINTFISTGISVVSGTTYTISVFTKSTTQVVYFGGATGGTGTNVYNGSVDYGNGWYRQSVTRTWSASGTVSVQIVLTLGSAGSTIAYGFQAELGAYPTSYIPTTSASATRVADACFKTGISSLIGQTEGTLFFELQRNDTDNDTRLQISDGSGLNWLFVSIETGLNPRAYCNVGGVNQFSAYGSVVSNSTHKVAFAYKSNDFKVYIDGVAVITQTSGSVPACNQIDVGSSAPSGSVVSTSLIKEVILFPTRLTNAELASLTTI